MVFLYRRKVVLMLGALLAILVVTPLKFKEAKAGYSEAVIRAKVEINGISFGYFNKVVNLKDIASSHAKGGLRVMLQRDFVTELEAFSWAQSTAFHSKELQDVDIILQENGAPQRKYVLKGSKPVSWMLERDPFTGGFSERIQLAVQEIAIETL